MIDAKFGNWLLMITKMIKMLVVDDNDDNWLHLMQLW